MLQHILTKFGWLEFKQYLCIAKWDEFADLLVVDIGFRAAIIFEESSASSLYAELFSFCMQQHLNLPISLIQRFKNDKKSLELLALAIIIKQNFQNSTLYDMKATRLMKLLKCGYKKATMLMDAVSDSELFVYNAAKGCLHAKTFKDRTWKLFGRRAHKRYKAQSDYCRKIGMGYSLSGMVRQLRFTLIENAIDARNRDNSKVGLNLVTKPDGKAAMTQRNIGKAMGMSRSSACRYTKILVNDGIVGKSEIVAECVIPELNDITEAEYRMNRPNDVFCVWHNPVNGGWSAWKVYGYVYSIISAKVQRLFRHVIYTFRHKAHDPEPTCSSELDGKW